MFEFQNHQQKKKEKKKKRKKKKILSVEFCNLPISGTDSDVAGTSSAMSNMNIEKARKTERPRLIFSPDVVGSQKVRRVSTDNMMQGTETHKK